MNCNKNIVQNKFYQLKNYPNIFIAGQLSGVEGYVESISSGLYSALNMAKMLDGREMIHFSKNTAIGSLSEYISTASEKNFQPMNSNWGIINNDGSSKEIRAEKSINEIKELIQNGTI